MAATAAGVFHTSYASELRLRHTSAERLRLVLVVAGLLTLPWLVGPYWLGIVNTIGIAAIGAVGLNILVGFTGQISLGQYAFVALGAIIGGRMAQLGFPSGSALAYAVAGEGPPLLLLHGSSTSSSAAFIAAVKPRVVLFAVGHRNRFGGARQGKRNGAPLREHHVVSVDGRLGGRVEPIPMGSREGEGE